MQWKKKKYPNKRSNLPHLFWISANSSYPANSSSQGRCRVCPYAVVHFSNATGVKNMSSLLACADDIRSNVKGERGVSSRLNFGRRRNSKGGFWKKDFLLLLGKDSHRGRGKDIDRWTGWKMSPSTCLPLIYSASAGTLPVFHMCWEQILFLGPANNGGMVRGNVGFWYNTNHWVICSRESSFATYLERINIRETALWLPSCYSFYQYMFVSS